MALTTLDPQTALIVVDLQQGIVTIPCVHPIEGVVKRARLLIDTFRERNLPVVLVNVAGGAPGRTERPRNRESLPADWTDLIPDLNQQPGDIVVTKRTWGADAMTDVRSESHEYSIANVFPRLGETGTTQDIIALLATRDV